MAVTSVRGLADLRVAQWVAEERARREARFASAAPIAPSRTVITISRQYGVGAHQVARLVSEELGGDWEVWGHEIVDAVAAMAHVRRSAVEEADEHSMSTPEQVLRYVTNYWGISPESYRRCLVEVLTKLGRSGKKIIVGHGSAFILPDALTVRLCASESFRMGRVMEYEHVDAAEARRRLHEVDLDRARFVRSMCKHDIADPDRYALTLRVDELGFATAAATIAASMKAICGELNAIAA